MTSPSQVSGRSTEQAAQQGSFSASSQQDGAVAQIAQQNIHSPQCDNPACQLRAISMGQKREITFQELKTAYLAAKLQVDRSRLTQVLAFGTSSTDPEIIQFVFDKIYADDLLSFGDEAIRNQVLFFCSNPKKAELAIAVIQKYANEENFPAMVHLAHYHQSLNPAGETEEMQKRVKAVADYFLDQNKFSKLFSLPTHLLTRALDFCLMVSKKEPNYFDGRRPIPARWLATSCQCETGKVAALIGYCFEFGIGFTKDVSAAFSQYDRGAERENGVALERLGFYWLHREDSCQAIDYFTRAAKQNLGIAQLTLAKLCRCNGTFKEEGVRWIKKAANLGIPEAIELLDKLGEAAL